MTFKLYVINIYILCDILSKRTCVIPEGVYPVPGIRHVCEDHDFVYAGYRIYKIVIPTYMS